MTNAPIFTWEPSDDARVSFMVVPEGQELFFEIALEPDAKGRYRLMIYGQPGNVSHRLAREPRRAWKKRIRSNNGPTTEGEKSA